MRSDVALAHSISVFCFNRTQYEVVHRVQTLALLLFTIFPQMIKRNINNVRRMTSHPTLPYCKYPSDICQYTRILAAFIIVLSRHRIFSLKKDNPLGDDYITREVLLIWILSRSCILGQVLSSGPTAAVDLKKGWVSPLVPDGFFFPHKRLSVGTQLWGIVPSRSEM